MLTYILRRLAAGVVLLFVVSTVAFLLLHLGSVGVARKILGVDANEATVVQKTHELGLDRPLIVQYGSWLVGAVHGDLGVSWFTSQPVSQAIATRADVTLSLIIGATILTALASVVLGVLAAVRGGVVDGIVQFLLFCGAAIPNFLVALALVVVFALTLHLFKPTGYTRLGESPLEWAATATLPIIALTVGGVGSVAQQVRGAVLDALSQDYVRTLRSRGLPERRVIFKHVLRNAGSPSLTVLALHFVGLLGGVVVIEQLFAIPGLGQIAVTSTVQGDIPLVMGLVVTVAVIVIIVNLLIDLVQGWLNPKLRLS